MRMLSGAQLVTLLLISAPAGSQEENSNFPAGTLQHAVVAKDIAWKPCAPTMPPGCAIAVLEGNPQSSGLFTVRLRTDEPFVLPPHTHPKDERVTVLKGRVSVAFIVQGSRQEARQFGPGDYYVNRRDAVHTVWADDDIELQITGIGPWEVNLVELDEPE